MAMSLLYWTTLSMMILKKNSFSRFTCIALLLITVSSNVAGQIKQFGWIIPDMQKQTLPTHDIAYIPDDGFNLYDKPKGEVIARLGRDPRMRNQPNYLLGIFLRPRDRTPELLPLEALAPLPKNCYAVPFVRQIDNFILLFDTLGPYQYWVDVKEIEKLGYKLEDKVIDQIVPKVTNTENGAGLLIPDFAKLTDLPQQNFAYIPTRGLTLYDRSGGKAVAKLSRFCPVGKFTDGNMRMFILPDNDPNNCKQITLQHLHHLSDDTYVIPFYENENGYIKLFNDPTLGSAWAKIDDIVSQDFRMVGWKEYYIDRRSSPAFANAPGLNLREGPYADAWCKVKVKVYKRSQCTTPVPESENLLETYEGWIKILGDDGLANVYINTKGC